MSNCRSTVYTLYSTLVLVLVLVDSELIMSKAESKQLIQPDDGEISEEESLVYISDEKHPSGVSKAAENRR